MIQSVLAIPSKIKLLAAIIAVFFALIGYHTIVVKTLEKEVESYKNKYNTLSITTDLQNQSITRLETLGKQYGVLLKDAELKNSKDRQTSKAIIDQILRDKTVPKDCDGAMLYLKENISKRAVTW